MKKQNFPILLFIVIQLFSSCYDSKTHNYSEETYLSEEHYEFSIEDDKKSESQTEFTNPAEVFRYLSDKSFRSPDGSKTVKIGYNGIEINGTPTYFNLEISVRGLTTAYIKGQSLSNPNGVINIRVDADTDCIHNNSYIFCL